MLTGFEKYTFPISDDLKKDARLFLDNIRKYRGRRAAITGIEFARRHGILTKNGKVSGAWVRKVVNFLRINGYPICSAGQNGYFWPENPYEILSSIDSIRERIAAICMAVNGMSKYLKDNFPHIQTKLEL